jgi:hypothetical protein
MKIEVSNGEIADKVSILMIKKERLSNPEKISNVISELNAILPGMNSFMETDHPLFQQLKSVNAELWIIEDAIRDKERAKEFDQEFIELARKVYIVNDARASIKRKINEQTGSSLFEEKSYAAY